MRGPLCAPAFAAAIGRYARPRTASCAAQCHAWVTDWGRCQGVLWDRPTAETRVLVATLAMSTKSGHAHLLGALKGRVLSVARSGCRVAFPLCALRLLDATRRGPLERARARVRACVRARVWWRWVRTEAGPLASRRAGDALPSPASTPARATPPCASLRASHGVAQRWLPLSSEGGLREESRGDGRPPPAGPCCSTGGGSLSRRWAATSCASSRDTCSVDPSDPAWTIPS